MPRGRWIEFKAEKSDRAVTGDKERVVFWVGDEDGPEMRAALLRITRRIKALLTVWGVCKIEIHSGAIASEGSPRTKEKRRKGRSDAKD